MITTELNISDLIQDAFMMFLTLTFIFCASYLGLRAFVKGLRDYFNKTDDHQKFTMR